MWCEQGVLLPLIVVVNSHVDWSGFTEQGDTTTVLGKQMDLGRPFDGLGLYIST